MCSSAVKDSIARLALSVVTLIAGAAVEELLPKWCGAGVPVLLPLAVFASVRTTLPAAIMYAAAAAGLEDSLAGLEPLTSVPFFLLAAAAARWSRFGWATALAAYPFYRLWLAILSPGMDPAIFAQFFIAIPAGAVSAFASGLLFVTLENRAAFKQ